MTEEWNDFFHALDFFHCAATDLATKAENKDLVANIVKKACESILYEINRESVKPKK